MIYARREWGSNFVEKSYFFGRRKPNRWFWASFPIICEFADYKMDKETGEESNYKQLNKHFAAIIYQVPR